MNVRSFPGRRNTAPGAGDNSVDVEFLLTLSNSHLVRMTGNADVIATRWGLRHLKSLGLKALVCGAATDAHRMGELPCANDEPVDGR